MLEPDQIAQIPRVAQTIQLLLFDQRCRVALAIIVRNYVYFAQSSIRAHISRGFNRVCGRHVVIVLARRITAPFRLSNLVQRQIVVAILSAQAILCDVHRVLVRRAIQAVRARQIIQ